MHERQSFRSHEILAYVEEDESRWAIIDGCRVRYQGVGFANIEIITAGPRFKLIFDDRLERYVGVEAFSNGQITHVHFNTSPADLLQFSPTLVYHVQEQVGVEIADAVSEFREVEANGNDDPEGDSRPSATHRHGAIRATDREEFIRGTCNQRQISRLIHFTRVENLSGILSRGLWSRTDLDLQFGQVQAITNDTLRADWHPESRSLSISFPNYRMFFKYRMLDERATWAVLELDPSILWELDCAFCETNAADRRVSQQPLAERKSAAAFENLFCDLPDKPRAALRIPPFFPTDPQAEVLVFDRIDPCKIMSVCFDQREHLLNWQRQVGGNPAGQLGRIRHDYFMPRPDHRHWAGGVSCPSTTDSRFGQVVPEWPFDNIPF